MTRLFTARDAAPRYFCLTPGDVAAKMYVERSAIASN